MGPQASVYEMAIRQERELAEGRRPTEAAARRTGLLAATADRVRGVLGGALVAAGTRVQGATPPTVAAPLPAAR